MAYDNPGIEIVKDIKDMMEKSSRFISLSGWSGIAAGLCALAGAWFANREMSRFQGTVFETEEAFNREGLDLEIRLFGIAAIVLASAFLSAFYFTYRRARSKNLPIWNSASRRLFINTFIPLAAGGFFIIGMLWNNVTGFVSPACLIFYGLALVNASKYTLGEVRYLGYCQIALGILNFYFLESSLLLWALGFGVLHIIYGAMMWWRYERGN